MKGVVFTEFLEMVEERFSPEVADDVLDACELASGGVYTAVGTYDHRELLTLVAELSGLAGVPPAELMKSFGEHLFGRFAAGYGHFFEGVSGAFDFLETVESKIHVEVLKLYPDAELPSLHYQKPNGRTLIMTYRSQRPLADLAEGLMRGCLTHFGESPDIAREELPDGARFTVSRAEP